MTFMAMAMMVSCSKDDDSTTATPTTLKGTLWEANQEYNIPMLGSGTIEAQLFFKTEVICRFDVDLPATLLTVLSMAGIDLGDFDSGEYGYTFDGKKVVLDVQEGIELEYKGNTLVYHLPAALSTYSAYLGGSEIVFRQQ